MHTHPNEQLSGLLTTLGISKSYTQPELYDLLDTKVNADGTMVFSFPSNLNQQRELARVWVEYTHLTEDQMLELIQAIVLVLSGNKMH